MERMSSDRIYKCDNRGHPNATFDPTDAGYFIPVEVGSINSKENTITYEGGLCFKKFTFSYEHSGDDNDIGDVTVTIDAQSS